MSTAVFEVGAALFGACVGSFLNVVIHRLPQEDPKNRSLGGRSQCPHCGVQILWRDNIPVLGWLMLMGKGRCCGQRIALRYPAVELLTAGMFLLLAMLHPFGAPVMAESDGSLTIVGDALAAYVLQATFLAILVASTFIDIDSFILPDVLTKPGMALGLMAGLWPGLAGKLGDDPEVSHAVLTFSASLIGLLVGGGVTWGIRALGSWVFRKEAMGFGDVKFLAMIGAFLGWQSALLTLFLGCVFGAVIGAAGMARGGAAAKIPFGPYLALGAVTALFCAGPILEFLFVTWPEWQRTSSSALWIVLVIALISLVLLFALVRKGRR